MPVKGDKRMSGIWLGGLPSMSTVTTQMRPQNTGPSNTTLMERTRDLEHHIERISLLNQALWELLRDKLNMDDAQLEAKIHEVDLRDGVEDGRMTETGLQCPKCGRISSSKHWKCMYCGAKFKKPIMG